MRMYYLKCQSGRVDKGGAGGKAMVVVEVVGLMGGAKTVTKSGAVVMGVALQTPLYKRWALIGRRRVSHHR
jgi:hypothetical protein